MYTIHERDGKIYHLPGRDWIYLIGPLNSEASKLVFGVATFPPHSEAAPHVHEDEEEIVYILSGRGAVDFGDHREEIEPGSATFIPAGIKHQIISTGDEPLKMVTVFSPPVVPGAYDPEDKTTTNFGHEKR